MLVFVSLFLCITPFLGGSLTFGLKADASTTIAKSCHVRERQALLDIKDNTVYVDIVDYLYDWGSKENEDCCQWEGVGCNNHTDHVIKLEILLSYLPFRLSGSINPFLPLLNQLEYLDLSGIDFEFSTIPNSLSLLTNLRHLRISSAFFSGSVPIQLANLSNLLHLDLSCNSLNGSIPIQLANLSNLLHLNLSSNSLSGSIPIQFANLSNLLHLDLSDNLFSGQIHGSFGDLTSLTYLNLSGNQLEGVIPKSFGNLSSLGQLDLSDNLLNGSVPNFVGFSSTIEVDSVNNSLYSRRVPIIGCPSLQMLDLSVNKLSGNLPNNIGKFADLEYLDLSRNSLSGTIHGSFGDLTSLTHLNLSVNQLEGVIPESFGNLTSLFTLDLSSNKLTGNLPNGVGRLLDLKHLDVSSNSLKGLISDVHFLNLTQLTHLDLSFNSFALCLSSRVSFNLVTIRLQSCKLGPSFPAWIQTQRKYELLDISNAGISDRIPEWFWDLPIGLKFLNLSSNEIKGMLPNMTSIFEGYPGMDLSFNQLEGMLPVFPSKLAALNLSGNRFSGTLSFLCLIDALTFLDLSNNLLSGGLPDCWLKFNETLMILNLSNNNLSGEIPSSLGFLSRLQALYLRKNAFVGEVPMSLSNCTKLRFMDLGENKLSGTLQPWIRETLSELYVLVLGSNGFDGNLPSQMCFLNNLQVLDLSKNGFSGNIPRCFGNFTAMATRELQDDIMTHSYISYKVYDIQPCPVVYICTQVTPNQVSVFIDNALVAWKGTKREFGKGLYFLKSIDISSNKLYGKLPNEITNLKELVSLNFSNNKLHGPIPKHVGRLISLQSLDVSRNNFSGNIPLSMSQLTFLGYLDLSYNNLLGRIPTGPQLQLFSSSSYTGNPQLCGLPLTQTCGLSPPPTGKESHVEEDGDEFWLSYYTGMSAGFVAGFCGICGALFLNRSFRCFFFASLSNVKDWIYVIAAVHSRKLFQS